MHVQVEEQSNGCGGFSSIINFPVAVVLFFTFVFVFCSFVPLQPAVFLLSAANVEVLCLHESVVLTVWCPGLPVQCYNVSLERGECQQLGVDTSFFFKPQNSILMHDLPQHVMVECSRYVWNVSQPVW